MDSYERQLTTDEVDLLLSSRTAVGRIAIPIVFRKSVEIGKSPEIKSGECLAAKPRIVSFDANGNITELFDSLGAIAAHYEYGPFGEVLRATGSLADSNPFRFSSKYQDRETGLLYYGYRYYQPIDGRWLNRDPLREGGFKWRLSFTDCNRFGRGASEDNLYIFCGNGSGAFDLLGLDWHHLLPKAIFEEVVRFFGLTDVDIHSEEYGWDLPTEVHTGKGGLHPSGWNPEWKQWVDDMKARGKKIRKCDIDAKLNRMRGKYSEFLDQGKAVSGRWKGEARYKSLLKRKSGITSVLFLASIAAGEMTGANAEAAEKLQRDLEEKRDSNLGFAEEIQNSVSIARGMAQLFGVSEDLAAAALLE